MAMSKPSNLSKINLVILALFAASFVGLKIWQYWWPKADIELAGQTLHVLVANTPTHQYRGLGKRDAIAPYDGMLFTFTFPRRVAIVMRDMRFPIDIVWFFNGEVIDIAPNVQPEDVPESELTPYVPREDADMVLELPAGWAGEHDLKIGDILEILEQ